MLPACILLMLNSLFFTLRLSGSAGSFPRPLKPEEEQEYLARLAQGDPQARNLLIEHNLRLVAHIIKKDYCKRLIRPAENGLKPVAPAGDKSLSRFAYRCSAPAPQCDPGSSLQLRCEPRL